MASAQPTETALALKPACPAGEPLHLTLLELVKVVTECTSSEREVVATVRYMLESGQVRLTGCFRDRPL